MKHILSYTLLACTLLPVSPLVAQMTVNDIAPVSRSGFGVAILGGSVACL